MITVLGSDAVSGYDGTTRQTLEVCLTNTKSFVALNLCDIQKEVYQIYEVFSVFSHFVPK